MAAMIITNEEFAQAWEDVHETQFDWLAPMPELPEFLFYLHIEGKTYGFGTKGGIIELDGLSKSRKSTLAQIIVAACLRSDRRYMQLTSKVGDGKILWFDTEQTATEFKISQRTIGRMCFWDRDCPGPERYHAFHLRPYSQAMRLRIIRNAFELYEDIAFVVIDGAADLVEDSNDTKESLHLVTEMTRLCDLAGAPLVTNIHTIKSGNSSTGQLGHYLDKKASAHLRTRLNDHNETEVSAVEIRGAGKFPPFKFTHSKFGIPVMQDLDLFRLRPLIQEIRKEDHAAKMRQIVKEREAPFVNTLIPPEPRDPSKEKEDLPF